METVIFSFVTKDKTGAREGRMVVGWKQAYPGTCQITYHIPGYVLSQALGRRASGTDFRATTPSPTDRAFPTGAGFP